MPTFAAGDTDYIDKLNELAAFVVAGSTNAKLHIGDVVPTSFVVSGGLPPTSASLVSTTTAVVAYVLGGTGMIRTTVDATAKTYTASKDTYVDLGADGTYTYVEVANGAGTPAVTANCTRLAKVVTNGTSVTSVTDLRDMGLRDRVQQATYYLERVTATLTANRTQTAQDKSGTVALLGDLTPYRNCFHNGDFSIDQWNEGAAYTFASTTAHAMDGVRASATGAGTFTVQRVADPDYANRFALKVACTVADASIGATDNYYASFQIEGYDAAHLALGLASAASCTISFDMKFDVAGVYGVSVINASNNRCYIGTVTQNVASTRESKTVTLTLDTTGTWGYTNGTGIRVRFALATGSNFHGTANAWGASNLFSTSSQANFMSANTNVGYLMNFQVEKGLLAAPEFEVVYRCRKIARAQRYFEKSFDVGTAVAQNAGSAGALMYKVQVAGTTAGYAITVPFAVQKRAAPSMIGYNIAAANAKFRNVDAGADSDDAQFNLQNFGSFVVLNPQVAGDNPSNRCYLQWTADSRMT